jgi:Ni,Fe-hydrogenase I cytochrome b subunit
MLLGWFHVTRRRALTALLLLLLLAPIPLIGISERLAHPGQQSANSDSMFWLFIGAVLMGSAVRGARSALGLWAALSAVVGVLELVASYTAVNGSMHLVAGLLAIAISIVFLLIRDEVAVGSSEIVDENEKVHSR